MPEWLVERGIGETRAALVDDGEIIEARIELDHSIPAGSVVSVRLISAGTDGRNAVARDERGTEYLLPHGGAGITEGAELIIEVTREAFTATEPWKRPLARVADETPRSLGTLAERLGARDVALPGPQDLLGDFGWNELIEQARTGVVEFGGGELRISPTPAMTLIDVDGRGPPDALAILGAAEAAKAIRRLDVGGSIGIDLPTTGRKSARQSAAAAIDVHLSQPFERTAVNGFGFVQIVRPRTRTSLVELAQDRPAFEARALLRRVVFEPPGPKRLVAPTGVTAVLEAHAEWLESLARQVGGAIRLRPDGALPMSGGYAEAD